ncbi:MAG: tetratricopeptide repeat protein, partial [Gaiellaceae bacterium]
PRLVGTLALAGAILLAVAGLGAAVLAARGGEEAQAPPRQRQTVTQEVTVEGRQTTVVETVTQPPEETEPEPAGGLGVDEAASLNDEAYSLMQDGRWADALPLLERALPALAGTYSDDFRHEAYAEYNLGRTLAELDRCDEALPHLDRSKRLQGNRREIVEARKSCRKSED